MCYFSSVGGGSVNFLCLALFCDKALTGETQHSLEFLYVSKID